MFKEIQTHAYHYAANLEIEEKYYYIQNLKCYCINLTVLLISDIFKVLYFHPRKINFFLIILSELCKIIVNILATLHL